MTEVGSGEKPSEIVAAALDDDSELQAIRDVLGALVPLKRESRTRVLDYVLKRLGITGESSLTAVTKPITSGDSGITSKVTYTRSLAGQETDIRALKNEKSPRSANEMAALVAYYVSEAAPQSHRKHTINADDIKVYFKQASFKLPSSAKMTLVHAKDAGYLEPTGEPGQYRLNPVGYNLIVHNLPSSEKKKVKKKTSAKAPKPKKGARKSG